MLKRLLQNVIVKEFALMMAATAAVQLALGLSELADLLKTSTDPFVTLESWAAAFGIAFVSTVLKQGAVWVLAKLGAQP